MWGDLDALGIVFYPRYSEWIDACGHLLFEALGIRMGDLWKDRGILFGLVETSCRYRRPGRYHDEIEIVTSVHEVTDRTLRLRHVIRRAGGGEILVEGFENRICLDCSDPETFFSIPIPDDIAGVLRDAGARP